MADIEREQQKRYLKASIARMKEDVRNLKARSAGLDPNSIEAERYIAELAGLEAEIASEEYNLGRL